MFKEAFSSLQLLIFVVQVHQDLVNVTLLRSVAFEYDLAFKVGSGRVKKVQRVKNGHRYLWYLNPGPQCENGFWHRFFP